MSLLVACSMVTPGQSCHLGAQEPRLWSPLHVCPCECECVRTHTGKPKMEREGEAKGAAGNSRTSSKHHFQKPFQSSPAPSCTPRTSRTTPYVASASRAIFQERSTLVSCYANCHPPNSLLLPCQTMGFGVPRCRECWSVLPGALHSPPPMPKASA